MSKAESGKTAVSGFHVIARQILALARRSPNKAPIQMAARNLMLG
jgi:hypothetical protein